MRRASARPRDGRRRNRNPPFPPTDFPFPGRVVNDPWYWLRGELASIPSHEVDRDGSIRTANAVRRLSRIDRLVAVEPTAGWYNERAETLENLGRWQAAADDYLTAARLTRPAVGCTRRRGLRVPGNLRRSARRRCGWPKHTVSGTRRVGTPARRSASRTTASAGTATPSRYFRAREHHRRVAVVRQLVTPHLMSPLAPLAEPVLREDLTVLAALAMAHHRLGEVGEARARLADIRNRSPNWEKSNDINRVWAREAIEVVEGKPAGR